MISAMTVQTETLEALHRWLAERLPELRRVYQTHAQRADGQPDEHSSYWLPNVTTDGLLEALSQRGWAPIWGLERTNTHGTASDTPRWYCALDRQGPGIAKAEAPTPHEALCRAAKQALSHE